MQKVKISKPIFSNQTIIFPIVGKTDIDAENSFEIEDGVDIGHLIQVLAGSNIHIELPVSEEKIGAKDVELENLEPKEDELEDLQDAKEEVSKEALVEMINKLSKEEMLDYIRSEMRGIINMHKAGPLGVERLRALIISNI